MKEVLLLILATILWGIWGVADKYAATRAHPFTVQWMYSLPYILFIPIWFYLSRRVVDSNQTNNIEALGWAVLASIASMMAMLLLFFALQSRPASFVVALTSAYPIITLLIGVLTGTETLSVQKAIGILFIVAGVIFIQSSN